MQVSLLPWVLAPIISQHMETFGILLTCGLLSKERFGRTLR